MNFLRFTVALSFLTLWFELAIAANENVSAIANAELPQCAVRAVRVDK